MLKKKRRRLLFVVSILIAFMIIGLNINDEKPQDAVATERVEDYFYAKNIGELKDGVYRSTNQGFIDNITVELIVQNGQISDFKVVEENETTQIAEKAISQVTYEIQTNKTPKVDALSGATETSDAIIKGARDTIRQAGGNPDDF